MNEPFMNLLFNNMRARSERLGDFNAMVGTGRKAEEHLQRLYKRFGDGLLSGVEELIDRSERQLRAKISERPDGDYFGEGYIESDGTNPDPLVVKLKLTVRGDEIIADFTGTSAQTNGPTNCGPAMALNAVGTIVKSFLDPKTPINQGSFNPITVISEEGTFINARNDAPCGGMAECKFLIDSVVASAMGHVAPEMTVGDLKGGANHVIISGADDGGGNYIHTNGLRVARAHPTGPMGRTPCAASTKGILIRSSRWRWLKASFRCVSSAAKSVRICAAMANTAAGSACAVMSVSSPAGGALSVISQKERNPSVRRRRGIERGCEQLRGNPRRRNRGTIRHAGQGIGFRPSSG